MSVDIHQKSETRPSLVRYAILAIVSMGGASAYLTRNCLAVANTSIQHELGMNDRQMVWVFGAFNVGYFLFQIPGGWLGNRLGARKALSVLSICWSLMTAWTASVGSYFPLLCSRIGYGVAQAGMVPITAGIIRDWIPEVRRGFSSAVYGAALSIGGAVTMGLTAWLIDFMHWRTIFYLYSLVGIAWAIVFYLIYRNLPEKHPWINDEELSLICDDPLRKEKKPNLSEIANPQQAAKPPMARHVAISMLRSWSVWALSAQFLFRAAGYSVFISWFPAYLEYRFELTPSAAGTYAMYPMVAVILGGIAGGILVDLLFKITGSKWVSRTGYSVIVFVVCALMVLGAAWAPNAQAFVALMTTSAVFLGMGAPSAWAATIDISGHHAGAVMGVANMAANIGVFFTEAILGIMIDHIRQTGGDWNQIVFLVFGVYVACAISWLTFNPNHTIETETFLKDDQ